jgi:CYTH domain-containing protein
MLRLTRKVDADDRTRLNSSIYLSKDDFAAFSNTLIGVRVAKLRYRLRDIPGASMCVDKFRGPLQGLIIAEAEFADEDALASFVAPSFTSREITDDARYSDFALATRGLPSG